MARISDSRQLVARTRPAGYGRYRWVSFDRSTWSPRAQLAPSAA